MIRVRCVECDETLRVADEHAGIKIRCKHCGTVNQVPDRFDDAEDYDSAGPAVPLPPKIKRPKRKPSPLPPRSQPGQKSSVVGGITSELTDTMELVPRPIRMTLYAAGALVAGIVVAFIVAMVVPAAVAAVGMVLMVAGFVLMLMAIFGLFYDAMVAYGPSLVPGVRLLRIIMFSFQHWEYAKVHFIRGGMCLLCFLGAMILNSIGQSASHARSQMASDGSSRSEPGGTYGYGRPAISRDGRNRQPTPTTISRRPPRDSASTHNQPRRTITASNTQPARQSTNQPAPRPAPQTPARTTPRPQPQPQSQPRFNPNPMPVRSSVPPAAPLGPSLPLFGPDGQFNMAAGSGPVQVYLGSTGAAGNAAATEVAVYVPRHTGSERLPCVLIPAEPPDALCGAAIGDPAAHPECVRHAEAGFVAVLFSVDGSRPPWSEADPSERAAAYEQFRKSQAGLANAQAALALARDRLPIVDRDRLYALGLRSGGTVALLLAANSPEIKACVAYKPIVDRAEWLANEAPDAGILGDAGALRAFLKESSPLSQFQRLRCPVLLMTSQVDPIRAWGMRHLFRHVGRSPRSRYQEMNYQPHTAANELPMYSAGWLKRLEQ